MTTYHAAVWMDHSQAHVLMFDHADMQAERIRSRSHHKHQGKSGPDPDFFPAIAAALDGTHEVLLAGPSTAREEFRTWCGAHRPLLARAIVGSVPADHPTDGQMVALARRYFLRHDAMAGDPARA